MGVMKNLHISNCRYEKSSFYFLFPKQDFVLAENQISVHKKKEGGRPKLIYEKGSVLPPFFL
jgi:hypothetical protein